MVAHQGGLVRLRTRRRSFSLIETLAAVAIFSVAVVALIEGIAGSSRAQAWIENQSRALMLAQNVMEEVEYVGELKVGVDSGEFDEEDSGFTWTTEIAETEIEGLYEVHVVVAWMEGQAQRDVELVTYMRERVVEEYETVEPSI